MSIPNSLTIPRPLVYIKFEPCIDFWKVYVSLIIFLMKLISGSGGEHYKRFSGKGVLSWLAWGHLAWRLSVIT